MINHTVVKMDPVDSGGEANSAIFGVGFSCRTFFTILVFAIWLFLPGCITFGPKRIAVDSFNYNEVIARSSNEQMLLNLVRLRYREVPVFLAVGSVISQYFYAGNFGTSAAFGKDLGHTVQRFGADAGMLYSERPTITYSPLSGSEFSQQLLTPIPNDLVFSLAQSGWSPDQLLMMCLERLNHVENMRFGSVASQDELKEAGAFQRVVQLLVELSRRRAIEMQSSNAKTPNTRSLVFEQEPDRDTGNLIKELKLMLGLDPQYSSFRVTERMIRRKPDEITIRVRSILALMGFLSRGVDIPTAHLEEKRVDGMPFTIDEDFRSQLFPLKIHSQPDQPDDAFVAVRYNDYWFYISRSDQKSKESFGLLTYLFLMQAHQAQTLGPMITVPTS
ncbi:MAG: hypothetical protein MRK02_16555 [Candidatus Scalindua sp.]|nr:hypothetical protein [Candidatus Scalindua sp.]